MSEQRPIGFWLKLVDRLLDEQFAETLDEHGVTREQWQLLNVLSRDGAAADVTGATEDLAELGESGWIVMTPTGYQLTDRGQGALGRLTNVVAGQRTTVNAGIPEDAYLTTVATLEHMAFNLGWNELAQG